MLGRGGPALWLQYLSSAEARKPRKKQAINQEIWASHWLKTTQERAKRCSYLLDLAIGQSSQEMKTYPKA